MPITELGFKRRTYDEILNDKIAKAQELFGEDIETSELTPFGKFLRINAYDQSIAEEEAEQIYYSIFPNTAVGVSLDRLCVFVGIERNAATSARYDVTIKGTAGKIVPQGFLVGTETEINFANIEDTVIEENGTAVLTVDCVESGEIGNVLVSEITQIVNPSADVDSIENVSLVLKGQEAESDYELRNRFSEAREGLGSCNENAIKAALMRVPTVTSAGVIVNEEDTTVDGRPPHSFECFISGGETYHSEIAQAIFDKKPLGIKTCGKVSHDLIDNGGYTHTIKFSHTTAIPIYVRIDITTDYTFEGESGKEEIKKNLESYIDNIGVGNNLYLSSLYGKIHNVTGVKEVTNLQLSKNGTSWSANNVTVEPYEKCSFIQVDIKLNGTGNYEVV